MQPQMTGLPQPLEPQRTAMPGMGGMNTMGMGGMQQMQPQATGFGGGMQGMQPQATGFGGMGGNMGGGAGGGGVQPLVPQQTGPAPPVRFGVPEGAKKLAPQATGRRANLAAASEYLFFFFFSISFSGLAGFPWDFGPWVVVAVVCSQRIFLFLCGVFPPGFVSVEVVGCLVWEDMLKVRFANSDDLQRRIIRLGFDPLLPIQSGVWMVSRELV
jgi:hypothetical protein